MRRTLVLAFLAVSAFVLAAPAAHAAAQGPGRLGAEVVLNGRLVIPEGDTATAVVVFHGRTIIEGHVTGSVVVFDGATRISGTVDDNVIVFRGRVEVTEGAHIGGDLVTQTAPEVARGAQIDGERKRVGNLQFASYSLLVRFLVWLAYSVSVLVLGLLLLWLFPAPMEHAAATGRSAIGASIGWGIAMLFGLPVALVLVAVTLVGLPLALSMLLALWFLFTVAYTVSLFVFGRLMIKPPGRRLKAFFAGFGVLRAAALIPVVGGTVWTLASLFGAGAATVAVWRSRRKAKAAEWVDPDAAAPLPPAPATAT